MAGSESYARAGGIARKGEGRGDEMREAMICSSTGGEMGKKHKQASYWLMMC